MRPTDSEWFFRPPDPAPSWSRPATESELGLSLTRPGRSTGRRAPADVVKASCDGFNVDTSEVWFIAPFLSMRATRTRLGRQSVRASMSRRSAIALLVLAAIASLALSLTYAAVWPDEARAAEEFGIEPGSFTASVNNEDGSLDTQAGSHPHSASTSFDLNYHLNRAGEKILDGEPKDIVVELPSGFTGNPNATPRCTNTELEDLREPGNAYGGNCRPDTQVGIAALLLGGAKQGVKKFHTPLFNMVPTAGEVARLAFLIYGEVVNVEIAVRTSSDYGLTATVSGITQVAPPISSTFTLWGVPADPSHDAERVITCDGVMGPCEFGESDGGAQPKPFLTNPSLCGGPLSTTLTADSWENPGEYLSPLASTQPPLGGCEQLSFDPSLSVTPETSELDTPTGLSVDLHIPPNEDPAGLATPDLRDATVTLPAGVAISPSAANGLEGCTPAEIGLHTENVVSCPNASKLGTVQVQSPDLPRNADGSEGELTGAVYLGAPASAPITAPPYTIYLLAEGYGLSMRLEGQVVANPVTGQLTTTFNENPQLPFEDLKLDFFGGPNAALMTPPACGTYTTTSALTPYSSAIPATPSAAFATSWEGSGGACPSPLPFGPSFGAGSTSTTAGAFSSFDLSISRSDGQQALSQITLTTPPGLLGMLSSVPLCGEPQAAQGTCQDGSQIGTATAGAGAGSAPFAVSGPVYLTGPYNGAPFGLSVAIPAVAGPFDFGTVVVRSAIYVDPHTAQITVVSDPLPQMVDTSQTDSGVPVALQNVSVDIDRPGFIFNPTSCNPLSVTGALSSNQGASEAVSSPFQVGGCQGLAFEPSFAVSTQAKASKAYGASLAVKVASGPGQANIAKVDVSLPKQLPSRLTTLQKACTEAQFAANPAGCPAGSFVGVATAVTPVLNVPLTGPAILVSHGGAAFPDLVLVLQGQGVTIELVGNTDIKNGITYSKFETVPDAPVSTFELNLPESPHSILGTNLPEKANYNLCGQTLTMPTTITAQDGAQVTQQTKITVTGCPAVKIIKTKTKATSLLATLYTTASGTVTLSGRGLKTTSKHVKAGSSRIQVLLTNWGRLLRRRHGKLELRASLTVGKQAVAKTTSVVRR